jgi:hypothetical protein
MDRLIDDSGTLGRASAAPVDTQPLHPAVPVVKKKKLQEPDVTDVESLLLHEPTPAAVARLRIVPKMNTGARGKAQKNDKNCQVSALKRVRQNVGSGLAVGLDGISLVCSLCSVPISRYQTSIKQHLDTEKHISKVKSRHEATLLKESGLAAFKEWAAHAGTTDRSGIVLEDRYNGDTLSPSTHAYRLQVTRAWVMGGNPLSRLFDETSSVRDLLEDGHSTLSLSSSSQMGPVIRKMEQAKLKAALKMCQWVTLIFDGTTAVDEVFTIIIRTISDTPEHLTITQWLCAVKWLQYSMSARQQAAILVKVLVLEYGMNLDNVMFASADACSVNKAALNIIGSIGTHIINIPCVSHGASLAGMKFETPAANRFVNVWCAIIKKRSCTTTTITHTCTHPHTHTLSPP